MGLQIPHSICTQVSPEKAVWQDAVAGRRYHQRIESATSGGVELLEGHIMPDHIHMCLKVPPKFSIAFVIGFIKGKSAVLIYRRILRKKHVTGLHFWARGYCVSTVGLDEQTVRKYIREQEHHERQQLELDFE